MSPRVPALFAGLTATVLAATASADRSHVSVQFIAPESVTPVDVGTPFLPVQTCKLGETRKLAGFLSGYLLPPDDRYFARLNPAFCFGCREADQIVITAHIVLGFFQTCDIPVEVSVVDGSLDICSVPNPNDVLCGPVPFVLHGNGGQYYDFSMAMPDGCCIHHEAFLEIRFVTAGSCSSFPALGVVAPSCTDCWSYNQNPVFGFTDICADPFWPTDQIGNPVVYAGMGCCTITPNRSPTWGEVKTLYR